MAKKSELKAEERMEAVLALLRREESAAALARRYQVSEVTLYRWRDVFLAAGKAGLGMLARTPSTLLNPVQRTGLRLAADLRHDSAGWTSIASGASEITVPWMPRSFWPRPIQAGSAEKLKRRCDVEKY